jgi:serine O-acetyltransferase
MFEILMEDLDTYTFRLGLPKRKAIGMLFVYTATWSIATYRFGKWSLRLKNTLLRKIFFGCYFIIKRVTEILTKIEIGPEAEIGEGLYIGHLGLVIGNYAILGRHASLHQNVTIGGSGVGENRGSPKIGDNVYFGAGCSVVGKIVIGNNVLIGTNSVVVKSFPDNAVIAGVPATVLNYNGSSEYIHFRQKGIKNGQK